MYSKGYRARTGFPSTLPVVARQTSCKTPLNSSFVDFLFPSSLYSSLSLKAIHFESSIFLSDFKLPKNEPYKNMQLFVWEPRKKRGIKSLYRMRDLGPLEGESNLRHWTAGSCPPESPEGRSLNSCGNSSYLSGASVLWRVMCQPHRSNSIRDTVGHRSGKALLAFFFFMPANDSKPAL